MAYELETEVETMDHPDDESAAFQLDDLELENERDDLVRLGGWVLDKLLAWRNWRDQNFLERWKEYDRIWRGIHGTEDSVVRSNTSRSKFVSPVTASAIDSATAEIEEATWGRGKPFIFQRADGSPNTPEDTMCETLLYSKLQKVSARSSSSAVALNAAIYGTGIAELITRIVKEKRPKEQIDPENPQKAQVGFEERETVCVEWKPIQPNNFLIDPNSSTIRDALGVAVEEFVSDYVVERGVKEGLYRDPETCEAITDIDKEKDFTIDPYNKDRVLLTRYYGLVPKSLLFPKEKTTDLGVTPPDTEASEELDEDYVEAIVVILNDEKVLKAEESPYMMKDRPIVAFSWNSVPNRFWGRGIAEMGYNAQKALDAELRARQDSLALTVWPMMAMDASRLPRGFKFEVGPGKSILVNGNPSEALMPFKFGQLDTNLYTDAAELEKMIYQATGAVDLSGVPGQINGEATAAGMSMALSGAIKRYKKTLLNFHDQFLMPALEKTLWRYIQFDPEEFRANPYDIQPATALGIIAREYETQQMVSLLQNMEPGSPTHAGILMGIIDNSNLPNRSQLIEMLQQQMQPNPEAQQMQQAQGALAMAEVQAKIAKLEAEARKANAEAYYTKEVKPEVEMVNAMAEARPADGGDPAYEKLVKTAELALKEKQIDEMAKDRESNERITKAQMEHRQQTTDELKAHKQTISEMLSEFKAARTKKKKIKKTGDGEYSVETED